MEFSMKILLSPNPKQPAELGDLYTDALSQAEELYLATAYLTDWNTAYKLNKACRQVTFLVGTDFGLTRKKAILDVLRWLPQDIGVSFLAIPQQTGGFHPKIVAWKTSRGKYHCIIGSSNLSKAAFSRNYEANVTAEITSQEFAHICAWFDEASDGASSISKDWVEHHYSEGRLTSRAKGNASKVIKIKPSDLPHGQSCASAVRRRRAKQAAFHEIAQPLYAAMSRCSQGKMASGAFWRAFWDLWAGHKSRFQGSGIQFKGKKANWKQPCNALLKIIDASKKLSAHQLDFLVIREIDRLHKAGNPMRGAWLSEMLCHYLPSLYPVSNKPVHIWLSRIKYRGRRGASEGQKYVDLAQKLRLAVQEDHPAGAQNLAELDGAIVQWAIDRGLFGK
jgi:hypothetical protein